MPLYRYQCPGCGVIDERLQSARERKVTHTIQACEHCDAVMEPIFPVPNLRTGTTFMAGRDDGFGHDERGRRLAYAKAKAAGVPTAGKTYMPSLCRKGVNFDPQAWVSDDLDVKRILRQQGRGCTGSLNVTPAAAEPAHQKPYKVADDVVQREVDRTIENRGGDLTDKERRTIHAETRERLSPVDETGA